MAVKYAVANGNWNAGATWNDGSVPTIDDDVYLNGYTISIVNATVYCHTVTNGYCGQTGNIGGSFGNSYGFVFNGNIIHDYSNVLFGTRYSTNRSFTINGNLLINSTTPVIGGSTSSDVGGLTSVIINGNISGENNEEVIHIYGNYTCRVIINGNVNCPLSTVVVKNYNGDDSITINGNCDCKSLNNSTRVPFFIYGTLRIRETCFSTITVNSIEYTTSFPLNLSSITPINPATFECRYVGAEPNPNPYIIINPNTIASTYPPENKVLAPTQYGAQMELVGQYTPDYPPESVVLKDYVYGDSDDRKIGTMPVLSQQLISRLENCATVETVQQLLVAHLDN